jgi:predicted dehydrogenase
MKKYRVLLLGLGSIGKRHARLIMQNFQHEVVALRSFLGQEKNDLAIPELFSWDEVDAKEFDAAIIANPTHLHIETAIRCAERGLHLFIEKPVDCRLAGLEALLRLVRERQLSSYVAYPLRFHPVVHALKERLNGKRVLHSSMVCASFMPKWRVKQDYRKSYTCFKEKGGGVFFDMSHEIDMAEYLFGPVLEILGRLERKSDVTVDSDDCADLILIHDNGTTNVHLNMFSRQARRFVEVDTLEGYLCADLSHARMTMVTGEKIENEDFQYAPDSMYVSQLKYFFDNMGRTEMENDLLLASRLFTNMVKFYEAQQWKV